MVGQQGGQLLFDQGVGLVDPLLAFAGFGDPPQVAFEQLLLALYTLIQTTENSAKGLVVVAFVGQQCAYRLDHYLAIVIHVDTALIGQTGDLVDSLACRMVLCREQLRILEHDLE